MNGLDFEVKRSRSWQDQIWSKKQSGNSKVMHSDIKVPDNLSGEDKLFDGSPSKTV